MPFPPPMHESESEVAQLCLTISDPMDLQLTRLLRPWDFPGKNTGVGCHFLPQCMKMKSESEVAQSCPALSDPMDYNLPGSSIHGIFQARVLEWLAISFSSFPRLLSHKPLSPLILTDAISQSLAKPYVTTRQASQPPHPLKIRSPPSSYSSVQSLSHVRLFETP